MYKQRGNFEFVWKLYVENTETIKPGVCHHFVGTQRWNIRIFFLSILIHFTFRLPSLVLAWYVTVLGLMSLGGGSGLQCHVCGGHSGTPCRGGMGDTEPVIEDGANGVQDPVQECTDLINNRGCVKQFVNGGNNILIYISLLAYLENCTLPTMGNGHRTSFVPCNAELLVKCPKNFLKNYQLKMMQSKHNLIQ